MKKKIVLLTLVSVFLLSAVIGSQLIVAVAAQSVGVSPGDWAEYDVTISGNGTAPFPDPPPPEMDWVKITVQEISDPSITFQLTIHYANGSEPTTINVVDVDTGQGNGTGLFIAANLTQDDLIYTDPSPGAIPPGATINETIFRTYAFGNVEVNHWKLTMAYVGASISINYYWCKATGMMTEIYMYYLLQQVANMTWWEMEVEVIDIIPEFPPALVLPLFMIATLIAVWLGKTIWSTKKSIKKPSPCA